MKRPRAAGIMARAGTVPFSGLLGAVLAIPLLAGPAGAQQPPPQAVRQIEALLAEKAQRTPAQRKVSSQLLEAQRTPPQRTVNSQLLDEQGTPTQQKLNSQLQDALRAPLQKPTVAGTSRLQATDPDAKNEREATEADAKNERVMVDIRTDVTPTVLKRIRDLGGTVISSVPKYQAIRAQLPPRAVEMLAALDAIRTIRPADEAVTRKDNTSAGDVAHRANSARTTHSVDGTGIAIGVISDGVRTLAERQASGDLPARVTVLPGQQGRGDEGTAMLEIVHDLAPGAELYFATGLGGQARMAANIEALCEAGANVIVDDIGYTLEAAFQDDIVAQGVNAAGNGAIGLSNEPVANETPETALPNMWLNPTKSDPVASVRSEATYSVTFQGSWSTTVTTDGLPSGAHFTTLIGGVHNAGVTFLREGGMASAGVESMAEVGGTSTLKSEINAAMPNALAVIEQSIASGGTATATVDITLTTDHPRVTLLTMVAPSPDWFVGVSGLSLLDEQGDWLASRTVNLYPWDAGTEEGTEFSLSNPATSPQGVITSLRGMGKFSNEAIATLTFTRRSVNTAPSFTSATSFEVDENQTAAGTVVAADHDSGDEVAYTITGGGDASEFEIGETTGVLTFARPPNYESPADVASMDPLNDAENNEHIVTVTATGGTADRALTAEQTITVTVRNVEEAGTVSFSQVGAAIRAKLSDPDGGVNGASWQWARSLDRSTGWVNISSATSAVYTPSSDDQEKYLRATVSYDDGHGSGKQAQGISTYEITPPKLLVSTLVSGLTIPWDLAFTPDGTMLFTERSGVLSSRLTDGTVQTVTAEFGDVFSSGENGLMGIVVDPDFSSNRRFYTCQAHTGPEIQVIAWTINAAYTTTTRVADPLVGGMPASSFRHGGCRLRFGPQGYLWIATGDAASGTVPQDLTSLGGKVLRVDASTGAGAPANPFASSPLIYTYGHRNPQGLALRPGTSQMWSVEHGPSVDDEINLLVAGRNYGWDPLPGYNESVSMTDLMKFPGAVEAKWSSGSPTLATSGGIFLEGDQWGVWEGRLALATLQDSKLRLFEFTPEGAFVSQVVVPELNGAFGRLRTPMMGPDGALYVTTSNGGGVDRILRIVKDEAVPVTLKLTPEAIGENGGVSTVTVSLERESNVVTTVTVSATAVSPAVSGDFSLSSNKTLTIGVGQSASTGTVTITANNNGVDAPNKTVMVMGTASNSEGVTGPSDETLTITDDDATPVITTAALILVAENETVVATLLATDEDDRTEDLEWEITGGNDRSQFTLPGGARLAFTAAKDYEEPDDSNGDGDYEVTVQVSDGFNAVEVEFTVRLQDVDDTAPTVSRVAITSDPGTDRTYAVDDEIQVTVTFSETVEVTGTPQLRLELGGGRRTADYEGGSGTAALVFAYTVADGESDTDGMGIEAASLSGGTIRDEARNNAELDHDGLAADSGHKVDGVRPRLAASGGAVVDGTRLTLTYDEALDGGSRPVSGDFTVSGGDRARAVTGVRVNGSAVELTLDVGAEHGEAGILVSYTLGANPIQDVPGNDAEALSREPVTNDTPDTTSPTVSSLAITSNPGGDQIYAAEDEIEVTVTFSETVVVTRTPRMRLRVGSRNRTAGYLRGSGAAALVFGYEVALGDEDTDGVSIAAGRIDRNGGAIKDEADNDAVLDHEAVAPQAGHKVDGVRPAFLSAAVDGSSLTLTYGEALDGGSRPAPGDFTVEVGGTGRSVSAVSVTGSVVTLTLDPAVEHGATGIRVNYSPGTRPIRDAVGNDALALSNRSVTNTTGAPPSVTLQLMPTSISENGRSATVTARLSHASGETTTVTVSATAVTPAVSGDFTLSMNKTLTIGAGQAASTGTVTITANNNGVDAPNKTVMVMGTASNSEGVTGPSDETLTITDDDATPVITTAALILVAENETVVATLLATDEDDRTEDLEWEITGGNDRSQLTLPGGARLAFTAAKDYEEPDDSNGDGDYEVTVQVSDGFNAVEVEFTVRLQDVDDTAPTVSRVAITSDPGTDRTYAVDDEIQVTVTFSETVEVTGTPQLRLELGGGRRTADYEGGSGTAALVFAYTVADGESDTDGMGIEAASLSGGTIRDEARNNAELDHDGLAADSGHKVDGVRPRLAASGGAVVDGTRLTLTYDEALDGGSRPVSGDFTVSGGDRARAVTGVRVNGSAVELTLDVGAEHGEAGILVSYTLGANPIQDVPGNDAEALSREPVTNDTPDTTSPTVSSLAITSNPGGDQIYAAEDEIEVTVTFSETVVVTRTPRMRLRVGSRNRTAGYLRGSGAAALVFSYEVALGDEDTDGVSIAAGRIDRNGGTIKDEADNDAVLDHEAVAPQAGHKVDGVQAGVSERGGGWLLSDADLRGSARWGIEACAGGLHGGGGGYRAKRFRSIGKRKRGDPDARSGGGARGHGDSSELQSGDATDPGCGGQRRARTEQPVGDQHHGGSQHGAGDHESGIVRCSGEPGAGEAAGCEG